MRKLLDDPIDIQYFFYFDKKMMLPDLCWTTHFHVLVFVLVTTFVLVSVIFDTPADRSNSHYFTSLFDTFIHQNHVMSGVFRVI